MKATTKLIHTQGTLYTFLDDAHLESWIEAFLIDRKVQNVSEGTLSFYRKKLKVFAAFCETQVISRIAELTPTTLRKYAPSTWKTPAIIRVAFSPSTTRSDLS